MKDLVDRGIEANEYACYVEAEKNGYTTEQADACEEGKLGCLLCPFATCPQCGELLVFPREEAPYCEDCGWPDEDFGEEATPMNNPLERQMIPCVNCSGTGHGWNKKPCPSCGGRKTILEPEKAWAERNAKIAEWLVLNMPVIEVDGSTGYRPIIGRMAALNDILAMAAKAVEEEG